MQVLILGDILIVIQMPRGIKGVSIGEQDEKKQKYQSSQSAGIFRTIRIE